MENKILSAPVYNKTTGTYVGMFDYRDIVDFVLLVFHKKKLSPISEDTTLGITEIVNKAISGEKVDMNDAAGNHE